MGADKVLNKIRQEGEAASADILAAAKERAEASASAILDAAGRTAAEILRKSAAEAAEIRRKSSLAADLELRKNALASKRLVLDEAFSLAAKELAELPKERYEALVRSIVLQAARTGEEQLQIPRRDEALYKGGFLDRLNSALLKTGRKGALTLSEKRADISGGVLLIGRVFDVDGSFETLMKECRSACEREVCRLLFGTEVR